MIKAVPQHYTDENNRFYDPIIWKPWFVKFHSAKWNPLGNKQEPLPTPEKNAIAAEKSRLNKHIWWALRNPAHNPTHRRPIGLLGEAGYLEWRSPEEYGWKKDGKYWIKDGKKRRIYDGKTYGWQSRGNFRMSRSISISAVIAIIILGSVIYEFIR